MEGQEHRKNIRMLQIKLKQMHDGTWMAKATVCGTCVDPRASEWVSGKTSVQARKKLRTKLRQEFKRIQRAAYRVDACIGMVFNSLDNEVRS